MDCRPKDRRSRNSHSGVRHDERHLIQTLIACLCQFQGEASLHDLCKTLTQRSRYNTSYPQLCSQIASYPHIFQIRRSGDLPRFRVSVRTSISLCQEHCKAAGCSNHLCKDLHVCKFYLLSNSCTFNTGRKSCKYGHSFQTDHNQRALMNYYMDSLDDQVLRTVLCRIENRTSETKPTICAFYNKQSGCSKPKCQFLHLCEHYVAKTCKFGRNCKRNHDLNEDAKIILERYGIATARAPGAIMADLRLLQSVPSQDTDRSTSEQFLRRSLSTSHLAGPLRADHHRSYTDLSLFGAPQPTIVQALPTIRPQTAKKHLYSSHENIFMKPQSARPKTEYSTDICTFFLTGKCWYGDQCRYHHKKMIYQWQYKVREDDDDEEEEDSLGWSDFHEKANTDLEQNYSQPEKEECYAKINGVAYLISFKEPMTGTSGSVPLQVRRLSTKSSEDANVSGQMFKWVTEWIYYFEDEKGKWIPYGQKDIRGYESSIDSQDIEQKFLENSRGCVDFHTSEFQYELDLGAMKQRNKTLKTERQIRRRPKYFKEEDLANRKKTMTENVTAPTEWSKNTFKTSKELLGHYEEVQVSPLSEEYKQVSEIFYQTMSRTSIPIATITRIENGDLWSGFSQKKEKMTAKIGRAVEERQLFHGTNDKFVSAISRQNFDFRFSGERVGTRFGQGSYFARDAKYSHAYTDKNFTSRGKMFVARVLVGDFVGGDGTYKRPPRKPNSEFELYDCCVDNEGDPSIFVLFSLDQMYPEYLITY